MPIINNVYKESQSYSWVKVSDAINKWKLHLMGTLYYMSPSRELVDASAPFVDENYTQSGNTYSKTVDNRTPKTVIKYAPIEDGETALKIIISLKNPFSFKELKNHPIQKI